MKTKEIANLLEGDLEGDGEIEISQIASLEKSQKGDIVFSEKPNQLKNSEPLGASCLIVPHGQSGKFEIPIIKVEDPKLSFARIGAVLHPPKTRRGEVHSSAVIATNAKIGQNVFVGAFCCVGENSEIGDDSHLRAGAKIGDGVKIGKNCVLHPNVFVEDNSTIGDNVILHPGVVIGADGFGYVRDNNSHVKFPQIGTVVIEDSVEIGANSSVDRGALGETRIGEGTKIDNLVQIAHNVQVGKRVVIAALSGISGSVTIEDDCVIAGQVGIADHTVIKKGVIIAAKSAVFPGKIIREGAWGGIPVQPLEKYKKQRAYIKSIPRLKMRIEDLENLISKLETK